MNLGEVDEAFNRLRIVFPGLRVMTYWRGYLHSYEVRCELHQYGKPTYICLTMVDPSVNQAGYLDCLVRDAARMIVYELLERRTT